MVHIGLSWQFWFILISFFFGGGILEAKLARHIDIKDLEFLDVWIFLDPLTSHSSFFLLANGRLSGSQAKHEEWQQQRLVHRHKEHLARREEGERVVE